MGELVSRPSSAQVSRPNRSPELGPSKRPDEVEWSGATFTFDDLDAAVTVPTSPVVAEAARVEDKARRRRSGETLRRRWGWRADRTGYVVVQQEQGLRPRPDGRFSPVGAWRTISVARTEAVEVKRRVGDVPDDQPASGNHSSVGDRALGAGGRPDGPPLHRDLELLPASVRLGLVRAVPQPHVEHVLAQQWSVDSRVQRHTVSVLRHDAQRAVVIQASRQHGASAWQVEQVTYSLPAEPSQAPKAAGTEAWEGVGQS